MSSILCYLGIHRWDTKDMTGVLPDGTKFVDTFNRCTRPGCKPRYQRWFFVNRDLIRR